MTLTHRRRHMAILATCVTVGLGASIGIAYAAQSDGSNGPPNTAGAGAQARAVHASAAPINVSSLPTPAQAALATIGAKVVLPLASVGGGTHTTAAYGAAGADGRSCIEVTHASGNIAEPPNCASDAYLRVWNDASGTGTPGSGPIASKRIVAAVSAEVNAVRVTFSDGSTLTYTPDANGIVTLERSSGESMPTQVDAINASGVSLASINVS